MVTSLRPEYTFNCSRKRRPLQRSRDVTGPQIRHFHSKDSDFEEKSYIFGGGHSALRAHPVKGKHTIGSPGHEPLNAGRGEFPRGREGCPPYPEVVE